MEIYSLSELGKYVKQVIALNFVDSMWISCEISQVNTSRGHCYLNLVEKDEVTDEVKASMNAAIWFKDFQFIRKKLGAVVDKVLQDGMEVKLKVELDFHERYGLKLLIKDIDPSHTFGQLAINREQTIQQLKDENRIELNSSLPFPTVVQRIAIISSNTAAGYQDLIEHLENNQYKYKFKVDLFAAAMQGQRTEMEVISQLREIKNSGKYQVAVITRGGGSKLDLAAFDSYAIAKEISEMKIPVITGIGHDIDISIADMVSAVNLKTPTAVANFMIDHNAAFESELYNTFVNIKLNTERQVKSVQNFLDQFIETIQSRSIYKVQSLDERVDNARQILQLNSKSKLKNIDGQLSSAGDLLAIANPANMLKKGYAIPTINGKNIKSIKEVSAQDELELEVVDGTIKTTVQ